jgi:hypothetical protein
MVRLTISFVCAFLFLSLPHADACSTVASLGYINVIYALDLAYIEEQT